MISELAPGIYHLQGGSNMGLLVQDGKGLLVDAGLDKDAARRALRAADELGVVLEAVFLTHAHADHFGGAHVLQRRLRIPLYAATLEAAMMQQPMMEPLSLFGGATPIKELRHKFTLAKPCRIDHIVGPGPLRIGRFRVEVVHLPGHSPNQLGLAAQGVLFCADAVFPGEVLQKHKVVFCVDLDETLATLEGLPNLRYDFFAPGHGSGYGTGQEITRICDANRQRLEEVRERVWAATEESVDTVTVVQQVADHFELHLTSAVTYFLTQTTILAALSSLEKSGEVTTVMEDNRLLWQRS